MITQANLAHWTDLHASALVRMHLCAADVMAERPLTTAATDALNRLNGACAALSLLTAQCQAEIRARYDEAEAMNGEKKPADAQTAVLHLRGLRDLTQTTARQIKAQCRHWAQGTWAVFDREVVVERIESRRS